MQSENDKIIIQIDNDLETLIPKFLEKRDQDIIDIRNAIEHSDCQIITRIGHNLKGVGTGYGFVFITEMGAKIEDAGKKGNISIVSSCIDEIEDYLNRVVIEYI